MGTLRGLFRQLRRSAAFWREVHRSYPPGWTEVVEKYGLNGRDRMRLREIVHIRDADLDPSRPMPVRTPDVADRLREDPDDGAARKLLASRGYELEGDRLRRQRTGEVRTAYLVSEAARELYDYLWPLYESSTRHPAANPADLRRDIVKLLKPYYPDVTPNRIRGALENHPPVQERRR